MPLSPRAAIFIAPALIVTAGAILLSRHADQSPVLTGHGTGPGPNNMLDPSAADSDSARLICQKQAIALDLLCGRCLLDEAADRFVEASQAHPAALDRLRGAWPGRTDRERAMAQAISFARTLSRSEPERFREAMTRIEADAKAMLGDNILH